MIGAIFITALLIACSQGMNIDGNMKIKARAVELSNLINKLDVGWKAEPQFTDWKLSDIKKMLGALPGGPELPMKEIVDPPNPIPDTFDSRTQWPNCPTLKQVRDQADCGSCWAFGAVTAISDRICIASGSPQYPLSATDMVACCTSCGSGCNGGYPSAAWQYWVRTGLVTGDIHGDTKWCYPYPFPECEHGGATGSRPACPSGYRPTPKCTPSCQATYNSTYSNDKKKGRTSYSVSSRVDQIQTEIQSHGPVEVVFTVYEDFLHYKSGVYRHTSGSALGGHAVRLIGWGTEAGTPYWLIINSWNDDWGDKGLFKIRRGYNECGIESQVVAGLP